jgi:transposase
MATLSFGGIDVSKDRLDVLLLPRGMYFSVRNNAPGWTELVARLRPFTVAAIGLEPSGGYERGIIRTLLAAGLSVRRINPNKLRQFARARGVLAKNDRLDARLIAEYVAAFCRSRCSRVLVVRLRLSQTKIRATSKFP